MNTHVVIYDGYVSFEIMLALYLMKTKGDIITVGVTSAPVKSYEGLLVTPHQQISDITHDDIEVLIIPGGDIEALKQNEQLISLLQRLNADQKYVGAICSGVELMKRAGILEGREFTSNDPSHVGTYKVDQHIITAKANGYADFAIELGKMLRIYTDEEDYDETIRFFKYFENA